MYLHRSLSCLTALLLAGCGPDMVSTTATAAKLKAEELEQAKAKEAEFKNKLDQALKATESAASAVGSQ